MRHRLAKLSSVTLDCILFLRTKGFLSDIHDSNLHDLLSIGCRNCHLIYMPRFMHWKLIEFGNLLQGDELVHSPFIWEIVQREGDIKRRWSGRTCILCPVGICWPSNSQVRKNYAIFVSVSVYFTLQELIVHIARVTLVTLSHWKSYQFILQELPVHIAKLPVHIARVTSSHCKNYQFTLQELAVYITRVSNSHYKS